MYLVNSGVIPSIPDSRRILERASALEIAAASLRAVVRGGPIVSDECAAMSPVIDDWSAEFRLFPALVGRLMRPDGTAARFVSQPLVAADLKLGVVRTLAGAYRLGSKNIGRAIC
ncbi:hypothetical protein [Pleomorphomonas carboxyditropha]|uniref:hypothetical protein n=1 Tax=Pleomorphomonas carboxyditropha TaxID=2023338 RepID=UPI001055586B|nr:hypothetical protein [Pleomorphomonas carboxyditropha]